jgi:hypothetical protein
MHGTKFSNILSEKFVLNSPVTVCHSLLYLTCCLNGQEQDGNVASFMTKITAYKLPPNFLSVYVVFIIDKSIVLFSFTNSALFFFFFFFSTVSEANPLRCIAAL